MHHHESLRPTYDEPIPDFEPLEEQAQVTIIVAIVFDTGIVMAADGQTTSGQFKLSDTNKLTPLSFKDGAALIGGAGSQTLSGRCLKEVAEVAKNTKIDSAEVVPKIIADAMFLARKELRRQNFGCSAEELNRIIRGLGDCTFLVGYFHELEPKLFKFGINSPVECPIKAHYAAIGSGRMLAEYLLDRITWPGMNVLEAELAAIYVVEEVKRYDAFCSGTTTAAFVSPEHVVADPPERVAKGIQFSATLNDSLRAMSLKVVGHAFADAFLAHRRAWLAISAYVRKNPKMDAMPVHKVARRMAKELKGKKGLPDNIMDSLDSLPPFMVRFLAKG